MNPRKIINRTFFPDITESEEKTKLVSRILLFREFEVPDWFVDALVTKKVIEYLLTGPILLGYPFSSIRSFKVEFGETLDRFINFTKKIIYDKDIIKLTDIVKDLTMAQAILLLQPNQWGRYIKYRKRGFKKKNRGKLKHSDWILWLIFTIEEFSYNDMEVPESLLRELFDYDEHYMTQYVRKSIDVCVVENIVKSLDSYGLLQYHIWMLSKYWSLGGTFFPKNVTSINQLISLGEEYLVRKYEENLNEHHLTIPYEYLLYKYADKRLIETCQRLQPLFDSVHVISYLINDDFLFAHLYDILFNLLEVDGRYDVNVFSNVVDLVSRDGHDEDRMQVNYWFTGDPSNLRKFEKLITDESKVPLKDFGIYSVLTGRIGRREFMERFIERGGSPQTIMESNISRSSNVCYTASGLRLILGHSDINDIVVMLKTDEIFVSYICEISKDLNPTGLTTEQLMRLIQALTMIPDKDISDELSKVALRLMRKIGESNVLSSLPQSIRWIVSDPYMKTNYAAIMDYIRANPSICAYIPVQYMPSDRLVRYMSGKNPAPSIFRNLLTKNTTVGSEGRYNKINTTSMKLDELFKYDRLYDLIRIGDGISYIPDLSPILALDFIDKLSKESV